MKTFQFYCLLFIFVGVLGADEDYGRLVNEANEFFMQSNFEKSKEIYTEILKSNKDPIVLYNLGNVYMANGDLDMALTKYNEAIELKPDNILLRNIHYHIGNALLEKGKKLVEANGVESNINLKWADIKNRINETISTLDSKNPAQIVLKNAFVELIDLTEFDAAKIENIISKAKSVTDNLDEPLKNSVQIILSELASFKSSLTKEEKNKIRMNDLNVAITTFEQSFNAYRKCLSYARKIGVEEGRNVILVGKYAKNNWAISRKLWNQAYEELKVLKKENLKLEEGIMQLLQIHESLFPQLEKIYLQSDEEKVVEYNMKVLAEFHQDYSGDIVKLLELSDEVLKKTEDELASLKNLANSQNQQNHDEKSSEELKLEKKSQNYKQISTALKSLQGVDQFVIEGLKNYDLFRTRKFSLQMKSVLHQINAFLKEQSVIKIFYDFIHKGSARINELMMESEKQSDLMKGRYEKLAIENYLDKEFYLKQIELILENEIKNISKDEMLKDLGTKSEKMGKVQKSEYVCLIQNIDKDLGKLKDKTSELLSLIDKDVLVSKLINKNEMLTDELKFVEFFHDNLNKIGSEQLLLCYQRLKARVQDDDRDLEFVFNDGIFKLKQWIEFSGNEDEDSLKEIKIVLSSQMESLVKAFDVYNKTPIASNSDELVGKFLEMLLYLNPDALFFDEIKFMTEAWLKIVEGEEKVVNEQMKDRAIRSMKDLVALYNKWLLIYPEDKADLERQIYRDRGLAQSISSDLLNFLVSANDLKIQENYPVSLSQLQYASALFMGQPQKAEDAIKISIGIQKGLKDSAVSISKNEMKSFDDEVLQMIIKFQTENMSLVGLRAIGLLNMMEEEEKKKSESANAGSMVIPGMGGQGQAGEQIDFEQVKTHLKEAIAFGEKIISFDQAKEFANSISQHDEMIKALEKALELLNKNKSNQNKDGDKNQDQQEQDQKNQEQQAQGNQQEKNQNEQQGAANESQEKKPMELSAEEARQLLKDLNHKDEQRHESKKEKKSNPNNTMRPW